MIPVFFDTEFTDLNIHSKKLISIGAHGVDSNGKDHTFYAEITDTYSRSECSTFVKKIVLPLLDGPKMSRYQAVLALAKFIEEINEDVILVSDAPTWDFSFFDDFLWSEDLRPMNLAAIGAFTWTCQIPEMNYMREHHAKDDAIINSLVFKECRNRDPECNLIILHKFT